MLGALTSPALRRLSTTHLTTATPASSPLVYSQCTSPLSTIAAALVPPVATTSTSSSSVGVVAAAAAAATSGSPLYGLVGGSVGVAQSRGFRTVSRGYFAESSDNTKETAETETETKSPAAADGTGEKKRTYLPVKVVRPVYFIKSNKLLFKQQERAEELREEINKYRNRSFVAQYGDVWNYIHFHHTVDLTYNSNAIEGSSLSRPETMAYMQTGYRSPAKPVAEYEMIDRHNKAIIYLGQIVREYLPINHFVVKQFMALMDSGVALTEVDGLNLPKAPETEEYGDYDDEYEEYDYDEDEGGDNDDRSSDPAYNRMNTFHPDGSVSYYADPEEVTDLTVRLCNWIVDNEYTTAYHPTHAAAIAHYNMVYDDGRVARLLMNFCLMRNGFPPAVIDCDKRLEYVDSWQSASTGDLTPFALFVAESLVETQERILEQLKNSPHDPKFAK